MAAMGATTKFYYLETISGSKIRLSPLEQEAITARTVVVERRSSKNSPCGYYGNELKSQNSGTTLDGDARFC